MNIDYDEILSYLGYKGHQADKNTEDLIRHCLAELRTLAREKYVYDIFKLTSNEGSLSLEASILTLTGRDIKNHLRHSERAAVMAVTLGLEVERQIAYYSKTDLTKGVIMDACASAAVEALCDRVEAEIRSRAFSQGFYLTSRFSPGYGDFPLEIQAAVAAVLDTHRKIGLTVTTNSLLIPRKSVTALIGLQRERPDQLCSDSKCEACFKQDCEFRRDGN